MGHLRWVVGIIISAIALYIAFVGVDWGGVGHALRDANYWLLLLALPLLFVFIAIRAQRWRLLFYPDTHITLLATFGALNIGYMAGAVLPLQLGEIARVYVLSDSQKLSPGRVLSTVAVERLLDVFALLSLLAMLLPIREPTKGGRNLIARDRHDLSPAGRHRRDRRARPAARRTVVGAACSTVAETLPGSSGRARAFAARWPVCAVKP